MNGEDICEDTLIKEEGALKSWFTLHTPLHRSEELPDPPYILIHYIEAEPTGKRMLQRHASEMIARIKTRLNSNHTVILQPANGDLEDEIAQKKLVDYYRSCGFDYLPSSTTKWWMTWPACRAAKV